MSAKDIVLRPIGRDAANDLVRRVHYSHKTVNNSQLHIGVFYGGSLEGAMQFGPSLDKRKLQGLVAGTLWNEFIELNRMAFSEALPRNSESRAIAVAMKMLRKYAPHLKWVVTFADGTQCGDGTIYRASGFVLTGIKKNNQIWQAPAGARESRTSRTDNQSPGERAKALTLCRVTATKGKHVMRGGGQGGGASMRVFQEAGFVPLDGWQLRYIYFLDKSCRDLLTVPVVPFSEIGKRGARMYKGQRLSCVSSAGSGTADDQSAGGGATPTETLQERFS